VKRDLTAVRLWPEQLEALRKIAAKDRETSISALIRRAVAEFLKRQKRSEK
jgi:predicted transcriptional regulator